jgi:hypothetical protein
MQLLADDPPASRANDPLLAALIAAPDEAAREQELGRLLTEVVQPVIAGIVWRHEEADDVASAVMLRVIARLTALCDGAGEPIEKLPEYVATLARNALTDALRRRHPELHRLRRRVRHVLEQDERFAIWSSPGGTLCGLRAWRGAERSHVLREPASLPDEVAPALEALFARGGGPLSFGAVVHALARAWGIEERVSIDPAAVPMIDAAPPPDLRIETRALLENLWREVQALRAPQRAALLLNLREIDGSNALALLVLLDVATFDEIAAAIELSPEALAAIWSTLPLDDRRIAEMLGVRRQQVINLRQAARQRLGRRVLR